MLMIVVLLVLSWVALRMGGERSDALGLLPTRRRGIQFLAGFLPMAFLAGVYFVTLILVLEAKVEVNDTYSLLAFAKGCWWTLRSVLYEEVLFRGVLLFFAMKYLGKIKGILLSSIIFGIFHWFSYNVIGDLPQMIHTFVITGIGGLTFAYAYAKTRSLYLPIGLHFGWNLIAITIFSEGSIGEQLLISSTENSLDGWWYLFSFLYQVTLLPLISLWCISYLSKKSDKDKLKNRVPLPTSASG